MKPGTDHNNEARLENEFLAIFRQHEYRLFTLALRLTKSSETAKDIVQDVFLKLWDQRATLHSIHNMEAWLYRVTENKVIDFLRKTSADSRLRKKIWYHLQQIVDDSEQQIAVKEYHSIIQQAIDQLPPQRKLIYQLHKETGLNYSQIADELQLSKHTVKNQIFSAVQTVRRFLSRHTKFFFFF